MAESGCVAVIGGGISGLAAAWRLKRLAVPVALFEAENRAGGLIGTIQNGGFLFESGPQSFQGTEPVLALVRELGIESELCTASQRAPRFVLRGGRLRKVPMSPQAVLTTSLLGANARWRVASEPFRRTKPSDEEESVANFVRRRFGHEILEYLVAPFVSGIYAGDPEKLSLRSAFPSLDEWEQEHGSVLRGAMKSRPAKGKGPPPLCSFRYGMSTLARAMAEQLGGGIATGARASAMSCIGSGSGRYEIRVERDGRMETFAAGAVVMAAPAFVASHLVQAVSPAIARMLSGISYAGVAVAAAGYHERQMGFPLDGFGVLIPRSEKIRTLGIVWNSSLFPGRAPAGACTITSLIGGATDPEILDRPEEEIASVVQRESARILEISGPPAASAVWKHPKALPQYNLGHGHIVRAIREAQIAHPGIFFSGNYLEGPSIGKCVEHGFNTAEAVRNFLRKSQ